MAPGCSLPSSGASFSEAISSSRSIDPSARLKSSRSCSRVGGTGAGEEEVEEDAIGSESSGVASVA